jgi:hypothetical protein
MFLLPHLAHAEDVIVRSQDNDDRDRAAGVPNCNEVAVLPCFEKVWVRGVQFKMDFFDLDVKTNPPTQNFYVVAPQTGTPQGVAPFLHDHVVGDDDGSYWHGFLALCSDQAISSGACVTSAAQGAPLLAKTVNGQRLTTAECIESAANAGHIVLVDTGAVLLARIHHCAGRHCRVPD